MTFTNVNITMPGGNGTMWHRRAEQRPQRLQPQRIGTRPAYGLYVHNADNIRFVDSSVQFVSNDGRPAVIANAGSSVSFDRFTAERGTSSPADMIFQSVAGYCVQNSANTSGGALRVTQTGSTQTCVNPGPDFSLAVTPASQTVTPGATATYSVATTASGGPGDITLSAGGLPAGATATFTPNPVPAGGTATLTVATADSTPDSTSAITVTGTAGTLTRTAGASLTVGAGGGPLTVSGLTVADTGNAGDWSVQSDLRTGTAQYGDRAFTFTTVPTALAGAQWIRTANDSKGSATSPLAGFTISAQATVAVAVDTRIGRRPWMDAGWVDTGTQLVNNEGTAKRFQVFTKTFPAGQVSLGPNGSTGSSMYTVAVF